MPGRGDGLAPVTYLPGVKGERSVRARPEAKAAPEAPTLATVFGASVVDERPEREPEPEAERPARNALGPREIAERALARRAMSEAEMRTLLRGKQLDEAEIEVEIARLLERGLIDDRDFARDLAERMRERKALGRAGIVAELRRRGVDPIVIEETLDAPSFEADDERRRAEETALHRALQLRSYDRETAERRLAGFLMRKGYSGSLVRQAVDAALSETHARSGVRFR